MDMRRVTIFAFILLIILFLGSKYAFGDVNEKLVTIHSPQREITKELTAPNKTVFYQTQVDHVAVTNPTHSLKEIKANYQTKFEKLQLKTNSQIDTLVEKALHDIKAYIKEDHSDDSLKTLYQSYATQGQKIEQHTEEEFQTLYQKLITELAQNGYPEDEAEEFKQIYEQEKEERKSEILKQALSLVRE
ncbi:hypothetical protein [Metabacillus halosaccharovorans]|uniref:DUF4047 domain-containing protein n=1 Tax=Metabacillus halosaccharovorans TaxID=930124 RepID=A0ABT3DCR9_9BACI|nr:hypothetical protein [Metabacillus halosaccharovorans]MCV9884769.1 hypothetical protein [Metabacillus halosaccharovorans]